MELKFSMNWITLMMWLALFGTLIAGLIIVFKNAQNYYDYHKYISDNMKTNIEWYYNCDSEFNTHFYNCPGNETLKNLTGYYCRGLNICQNAYRIR